jgi:hypothetical protein
MIFVGAFILGIAVGWWCISMLSLHNDVREQESARCWICGRTFSGFKGLYYHHRASHDDPLSAVLPSRDGPYRSKN